MSLHRMDADYNEDGPVLNDPEADFPARLQVATKDSFHELHLSRDDFESLLNLARSIVENRESDEREIDGGSVRITGTIPDAEDAWEVHLKQGDLESMFMLSENELEGFDRLLRSIHPDHEVDAEEDPNLEIEA